jgi:lipoprotein-releasing system permease protein
MTIRPSLPLYLALRYLRSTRRDAFITFLSVTTAVGIALGMASLILALAALSGFQSALRSEILSRTPQIEIELPANAEGLALRQSILDLPGAKSTEILVRGRGWLLARGRTRPVEIVGFDRSIPRMFPEASSSMPGRYVGNALMEAWGLETGEVVELASSRPTLTPMGPQPRVRRLPVRGTFASGRAEQSERIAVPLVEAEALLGRARRYLVVECGDLDQALAVAPQLSDLVPPGSRVRTWRDLNRALLFALRLEKSLMFVAVFLIVVVAAISLISDLTLILASKQPEIGMLGAMGATPLTLQRTFLWLGALLVGVGATPGLLIGIGGAWLLDRYRLLALPAQVYFLDHVPFQVRTLDVMIILLATLSLTSVCSYYAARKVGALRPVEALKR